LATSESPDSQEPTGCPRTSWAARSHPRIAPAGRSDRRRSSPGSRHCRSRKHPFEDDLKLLAWSDDALEGKGYIDWYPYDHPQLGPIHLGGWDMAYSWRNPPPPLLARELERFPEWLLWLTLISPRLELHSSAVQPLGGGHYRVEVVVANSGWLPTYVSKRALERKVVRGLVVEATPPPGARLVSGTPREVHGQLEGRHVKASAPTVWSSVDPTSERLLLAWVVDAPEGGAFEVTVRHERAGVVRTEVELEG
jgi:hypothetical protein